MTEQLSSWITLAAFIGAALWYLTKIPAVKPAYLLTSLVHAILCLFGGFLFSAAMIKLSGGFSTTLVPALMVCTGTALCAGGHHLYQKKDRSRPTCCGTDAE